MWTVLLVEDETFVRRSIRSGIPWEDNGFTVIGECSNGEEALEFMSKETPDLVVSDIRMPIIDGIDLLRASRQKYPRTRFVMLTVMNDFEHAQQALELGASGYVLKLYLTPDKMAEALLKVSQELERELLHSATLAERLGALLFESIEPDAAENRAKPNSLPGELREYSYMRVILHEWDVSPSTVQAGELASGNRNLLACSRKGMTLLLSRKPFSDTPHYPHVSAKLNPTQDIRCLSRQLCRRLDELWHNGKNGGYLLNGQQTGERVTSLPWALEKAVLHAFEQKQTLEMTESLKLLWAWMAQECFPAALARQNALNLLQRLSSLSGQAPTEGEFEAALSHEGAGDTLVRLCVDLLERWRLAAYELSDHPDLNRVIFHIHEHFQEDINLVMLSSIAMMDDKYLSVLFKKKMGRTLTQYVIDLRIKHACRLLRETDATVSEVAVSSGMPNENYFSRLFKRETGFTPSAYRLR
ncbi:two-component system, response regulator YesN [Paenibacillaceae bacterium GAS479]|nr:two-component system, response regulator YesN [Paenibacillaceae bacterium GAS479]